MRDLLPIWNDLRFAARTLLRRPLYFGAGILTLGLGIGANTLIFSVVESTLLRPLPYGEPERLVTVWSRWVGFDKTWVSPAEFALYRDGVASFDAVAMYYQDRVTVGGEGEPVRVGGAGVTPGMLDVLGAKPFRGRGFTREEAEAQADVVMLDHELWRRRFGGSDHVVGSTVTLEGTAQQVVGILPPGLALPQDLGAGDRAEVWWPVAEPPPFDTMPENGGSHGWLAVARLAPGATLESARAELAALNERWTRPGAYSEEFQFRTLIFPVGEEVAGRIAPALRLLAAAVALLLLIACANLASLCLAQALRRRRELAVRGALGAGRAQLARLMLAESLLIALAGGAVGVAIAVQGLDVFQRLAADQVPRLAEAAVNARVLAFTAAVSIAAALLSGLLPALWAARRPAQEGLRGGSAGPSAGGRARGLAVGFQVALAVVLVTGTGLMLRTVSGLLGIDTGFDRRGVVVVDLEVPQAYYPEPADVAGFYGRAVERIASLPGVSAAGAVRLLPLATVMGDWGVTIEGYQPPPGVNPAAEWQAASAGYFEAMAIPVLEGRAFRPSDDAGAPPVMVVNRAFAETFSPGRSALGRRVRLGGGDDGEPPPWTEVVGVVADVTHGGLDQAVKPGFYLPLPQFPLSTGFAARGMSVVARTSAEPAAAIAGIRRSVADLDPRLAVANARTLEEVVGRSVGASGLATRLLVAFSTLALVLAAIGIYGVTAGLVAQRRREMGIRLALGARPRQAIGLMLAAGARTVVLGLAAGLAGSLLLTRILTGLLYGVGPRDPLTFLAAPLLIAAVALLASYLPARRAAKLDPRTVLQEG